jgi:hypothetical protein
MLISTEVVMFILRPHFPRIRLSSIAALLAASMVLAAAPFAQSQAPATPPPAQPDQTAPDAGGPGGDNGVIALPKKKDAAPLSARSRIRRGCPTIP